jgi:hypothetical protein
MNDFQIEISLSSTLQQLLREHRIIGNDQNIHVLTQNFPVVVAFGTAIQTILTAVPHIHAPLRQFIAALRPTQVD